MKPHVLDPYAPPRVDSIPHALPVPRLAIVLITPTLRPGSVAAVVADDTLRIFTFKERAMHETVVAHRYLNDVAAGQLASIAAPSGLHCAYLQSRGFIVFDLDRAQPKFYFVAEDLEEMPVAGAWIDQKEAHLVVQIEDTRHYDDGGRVDFRLRSYDLSGPRAIPRGTLELGSDEGLICWSAGDGVVGAIVGGRFTVRGPDLSEPIEHPLAALLHQMAGSGRSLQMIRLHPSLPLAVFVLRERTTSGTRSFALWRATWNRVGDTQVELLAVLEGVGSIHLFDFSPTETFLAFGVYSGNRGRLYAQEVMSGKGEPLLLGHTGWPVSLCWIQEPLGLVAFDSQDDMIQHWPISTVGPDGDASGSSLPTNEASRNR